MNHMDNQIEENTNSIDNIYEKNVYSTTETIIGKWIDNKTIYRKVIELNTVGSTDPKVINVSISNINELTNFKLILYLNAESIILPLRREDRQFDYIVDCVKNTGLTITTYRNSPNNWNNWNLRCVVEYTKTSE